MYELPDPSAAVFQPAKLKLVLAKTPEFEASVVDANAFIVAAVGTVPLVFPLPS